MSVQLRFGLLRHQHKSYRTGRHGRLWILLLVFATVLALCGRSASALVNRVEELVESSMALEPDTIDGRDLYRKHCMSCHGRSAQGDAKTVTPALAGQVSSYVIKQLADIVEGYRELPEMHRQIARTEMAAPQALHDLAAYLATLPALKKPELGDGKQLELGEQIYTSVCADCHGARGEGNDGSRIPALRGQHYSYLLRQSRQIASGHRYGVEFPVIVVLGALSVDQLTAVADFISRLPTSSEAESIDPDARVQ
jgi:cytochrome c553